MSGETNLETLLKTMKPQLNGGNYVFCSVSAMDKVSLEQLILFFKEEEGYTIILKKELADEINLPYSYVSAWITLTVHSSLEAVGLTASFSKALAVAGISCNVVAGYYHDHIFVDISHAEKAMEVLNGFSNA